jgi:hypothetical protein
MKISDQLKLVRDALAAWSRTCGATVAIASDPFHLVALLRENPKAPRAAVLFMGESKRGEHEEAGMVDRTFWVVVSRGQGLRLEPGAGLVDGASGGQPLFDLVEQVRDVIRSLSFHPETTEVTPNNLSIDAFNTEGYLMDAYKLEFSIGVQLPVPTIETNE